METPIRVVQYGLGSIGAATARLLHERSWSELAGGIDVDPEKVGRDLGSVMGLDQSLGIAVAGSLADVEAPADPKVALHTTGSWLDEVQPQILELLAAGYDVVSTTEELSFPWESHPNAASAIDRAAKQAGKTVLGTGVNPGFVMDLLPAGLTAICQRVTHLDVRRVIDASARRQPFQAKIGSGLSVEDFREKLRSGRMGHAGLRESAEMLLRSLGKRMARYESRVDPILAQELVETDYFSVQPGSVIGLQQVARAYVEDGEFLKMTFVASLDVEEARDSISISGKPDLAVSITGTHGDLATAAMAVNAIPRVLAADPGLVTMLDIPPVTCWQ